MLLGTNNEGAMTVTLLWKYVTVDITAANSPNQYAPALARYANGATKTGHFHVTVMSVILPGLPSGPT